VASDSESHRNPGQSYGPEAFDQALAEERGTEALGQMLTRAIALARAAIKDSTAMARAALARAIARAAESKLSQE